MSQPIVVVRSRVSATVSSPCETTRSVTVSAAPLRPAGAGTVTVMVAVPPEARLLTVAGWTVMPAQALPVVVRSKLSVPPPVLVSVMV